MPVDKTCEYAVEERSLMRSAAGRFFWHSTAILLILAASVTVWLWAYHTAYGPETETTWRGADGDLVLESTRHTPFRTTYWGVLKYRTSRAVAVALDGVEYSARRESEFSWLRLTLTFGCTVAVWAAALTLIGNMAMLRDKARVSVHESSAV